jgi:hypothetical protein
MTKTQLIYARAYRAKEAGKITGYELDDDSTRLRVAVIAIELGVEGVRDYVETHYTWPDPVTLEKALLLEAERRSA